MKRLSIEQALVWAYSEQMVHVALPQGVPVEASQGYSPALSEGRFLADKVDNSVKMGFAAAPDAYLLHAKVQQLRAVEIARTRDEIDMMFARRLMKNDYDSQDRRGTGDATMPAATVQLLPRAIIQEYALSASRPDRAAEVEMSFERGQRVYLDRRGYVVSHHTRFGFHLLKAIGDDPLEVIAMRRRYTVWHQALVMVRESVTGLLRGMALTDELPPNPVPA